MIWLTKDEAAYYYVKSESQEKISNERDLSKRSKTTFSPWTTFRFHFNYRRYSVRWSTIKKNTRLEALVRRKPSFLWRPAPNLVLSRYHLSVRYTGRYTEVTLVPRPLNDLLDICVHIMDLSCFFPSYIHSSFNDFHKMFLPCSRYKSGSLLLEIGERGDTQWLFIFCLKQLDKFSAKGP